MASVLSEDLAKKAEHLRRIVREFGSCAIGFSGGVDSSLLLAIATEELPGKCLAILANSPSLPIDELRSAEQLAKTLGAKLRVIETEELDDPRYLANDGTRCYWCKSELWRKVWEAAREAGIPFVCEGANADDAADYRPGLRAAAELNVRAPLREAGLTKADVRELSRLLGLPTAEMPSAPCLSSRIPHGMPVTLGKLSQVEKAERVLKSLGFAVCRVRHFGDVAIIAVPKEEFQRFLSLSGDITGKLRAIGFTFITLDLEGLVSGSLNRILHLENPE